MVVSRHDKGVKLRRDWESLIDRTPIESRGDYKTFVPRWDAAFAEDDLLYIPTVIYRIGPGMCWLELSATSESPLTSTAGSLSACTQPRVSESRGKRGGF